MKNIITAVSKLKTVAATALLIAVSASCSKDYLVVAPKGEITDATFYTTAQGATQAVNALYGQTRVWAFHESGFPIYDIMSDDAYKGSIPGDQPNLVLYETFKHTPNLNMNGDWYYQLYKIIRDANAVLTYVPPISMDANLKARILGEAKFFRALCYSGLVRGFGGVPLITQMDPPVGIGRSSADEVYAQIFKDLQEAHDVLPLAYPASEKGRITKGAASSLMARMYLFKGDYANTEKYALEVINSNVYDLEADFSTVFLPAGDYGKEAVYEVGAVKGLPNDYNWMADGGSQYANTQAIRGTPNRGWGFNRPSLELMNFFGDKDPRKNKTIIFLGEVMPDGITTLGDAVTLDTTYDANRKITEIECYNQKVWVPGNNVGSAFGANRKIIRYSDVLLMAAEALNKNGKSAEALPYLNKVRQRARGGAGGDTLPDITETNTSALDDIIFDERRRELALEDLRYWDLVRTGRAEAVLGPLGFIKGKHELLPLPSLEVEQSGGKIIQNPQY
ncbi:MAG: RagB/SusD family nutrient uptake outer membrane protein [Bacteroidota bacterium]